MAAVVVRNERYNTIMIITNNEELLRRPCENVLPEEIGTLISALESELDYANRLGKGGIGLAAPQIGIAKKIAIVRLGHVKLDLVNSKIQQGYDPMPFHEEGCLSFPGRVENTIRFQEIHLTNNLVSLHSLIATGLLSVVCQHEIDHFNSTLFTDRMAPKPMTMIKSFKIKPNDPCPCGIINPTTGKISKYKRCHGK